VALVSTASDSETLAARRPIVILLIVASVLLSIVSWYTTFEGMALYLAGWFALLASLGIQTALVMVAWLIGFTKTRRKLLVAVYAITALVSIGFSYVSLYTWFSSRERPATVQRQLYDTLTTAGAKSGEWLAAATTEAQKHVLALDEMTTAEKSHGYISRAQDADPYLASVREAVAREAQTYSDSYKEGSGQGLRYTAFDRYAKMTRQSLQKLEQAQGALATLRTQTKPTDPAEKQLKAYHDVIDPLPWNEVETQLHSAKVERPVLPAYKDFVDQTSGGQEDLLIAFQGLVTAPTSKHLFSFALAAFIDVIIFLLAYASGPYFFGSPERRWCKAAAAMESADEQIFVRNFLRKIRPAAGGMPRVEADALNSGELQFCLLLTSHGLAVLSQDDGKPGYLLDQTIHEMLVEPLSTRGLPLRASAQSATA
jgi:hypothetical protein